MPVDTPKTVLPQISPGNKTVRPSLLMHHPTHPSLLAPSFLRTYLQKNPLSALTLVCKPLCSHHKLGPNWDMKWEMEILNAV